MTKLPAALSILFVLLLIFEVGAGDDRQEELNRLIELLKDTEKGIEERVRAAFELGKLGDNAAVDALLHALNDKNLRIRAQAALSLGMLGDSKAIPALIESLDKDREAAVRCAAAVALGDIGDKRAHDALRKALSDRAPGVEAAAVESLGKLGGEKAIKIMLWYLSSNRERELVRSLAAQALGRMRENVSLYREEDFAAGSLQRRVRDRAYPALQQEPR